MSTGDELHAVRRVNDDGTRQFLGVIPARLASGVIPMLLDGSAQYAYGPLTDAEHDALVPREPEPPEPCVRVRLPGTVPVTMNAGAGETVIMVPLGDIDVPGSVALALPDRRGLVMRHDGTISVVIPVPGTFRPYARVEFSLPGEDSLRACDANQEAVAWRDRHPGLDLEGAPADDPYPDAGDTGTIMIKATHYHD